MMIRLFFGIVLLMASASAANAQNRLFTQNIITAISAEDVAQIFTSFGYTANVVSTEGEEPIVEVMQTNGRFYVAMRQCADGVCQLVQPYGLFNGQGVTLSQLNEINLNRLNIANTMLLDDGAGIIANKVYLQSGASVENLKFNLGLFIQDLNVLVNAIQPGAVATISLPIEKNLARTHGLPPYLLKGASVNAVGVDAPNFITPALAKHLN
ncbi:MAG: YbjN domain-containing protein [Pseudomonadota bacterium]